MEHVCHTALQIFSCRIFSLNILAFSFRVSRCFSDGFYPVQQRFVVKRFHDIVICASVKGIFCDLFLSHRCDHDKIRTFAQTRILIYALHHSQSVHFRHNQVEKNNIRLSGLDDLTHLFTVLCFSYQIQLFIHAYDSFKHVEYPLVVVSYGYTQMLHTLLSFRL